MHPPVARCPREIRADKVPNEREGRQVTKSMGLPATVRVASALYALPGLGFGIGTVGTLAYLVRNG